MTKRLENRIQIFNKNLFRYDNDGRYIPLCACSWHIGVIVDEKKCKTVNCNNYYKFYIKPKNNY